MLTTSFKNSFIDLYLWIGAEKPRRMWPVFQGCGFQCLQENCPEAVYSRSRFLLGVSWAVRPGECLCPLPSPY